METNRLSFEDYKAMIIAALCFCQDDVDFTLSEATDFVNRDVEFVEACYKMGLSVKATATLLLD